MWRCSLCSAKALSSAAREERQHEKCRGDHAAKQLSQTEGAGHSVRTMSLKGAPFLFCSVCGAHGFAGHLRRRKSLSEACQKEPTSRFARTALSRMLAGKHPKTKVPFDGHATGLRVIVGKESAARPSRPAKVAKRMLRGKQRPPGTVVAAGVPPPPSAVVAPEAAAPPLTGAAGRLEALRQRIRQRASAEPSAH